MSETRRLLEAAHALSVLLRSRGVPHAFYGSALTAALANHPHSDEISCIVEGGQTSAHPFRRVREAVATSDDFAVVHSPWTNRRGFPMTVNSTAKIEILPAGETGPRRLDTTTIMKIHGVPFLTVTEFIRAKLKVWAMCDRDARDILYMMLRYWQRVDFNRISEHDMDQFVNRNADAAPAWFAIKKKYRA
ncbi:hypothetical protein CPB85DRAFT_1336383 [Mucidula mucida]|nr:hypothetical protein CPB85DRAFT_1336383 [Mucidula mucida]